MDKLTDQLNGLSLAFLQGQKSQIKTSFGIRGTARREVLAGMIIEMKRF